MKNNLFLAFLLAAFTATAQDCDTNFPPGLLNGLLVHYPFSNGSTNDFSGHSRNLSNMTAAHSTTDRFGNPDCAFEFNNLGSTTEFLSATDTAFLNGLSAFSISLWYNVTGGGAGEYRGMISRDDTPSCPDRRGQWSLGVYDGHRAVFSRKISVWQGFENWQNFTNNWQYATAVFDGQSMKIYINGVLQQTGTGTANCTQVPQVADFGDLFLGKRFTGKIDDVFLYDRALTETEINQLYTIGACCTATPLVVPATEKTGFQISPNPVQNLLQLQLPEGDALRSVTIYNVQGQQLLTVSSAKLTEAIDVSSLASGSYVAKVVSEKGSASVKFVKQ